MPNNKISYLNRNFEDYKNSLQKYLKEYYPQISTDVNDASVGSWIIDMMAAVSDNLGFYIDKAYNETSINTASMASSVYALARSNGLKVPGPKGAISEVKFTCELPVVVKEHSNGDSQIGMPNFYFAPIIKKGTKVSSSTQVFEVMEDIDFSLQFDSNMISNRTIEPVYDSNKKIIKYKIHKTAIVTAGESKVYRQVISAGDIKPFMEIVLPEKDIMNIESIIFKDGSNFKKDPSMSEFMQNKEHVSAQESLYGNDVYRFFEVDSLSEQYRWGDDIRRAENQAEGQPETYLYGYYDQIKDIYVPTVQVAKGQWIPLTQKFITEFTDRGYMKIIFGSGEQVGQDADASCAGNFTRYQISKMVRNNFLGRLPKDGWTMYVLYRVGGGAASNVAKGAINKIEYLNAEIGKYIKNNADRQIMAEVRNSLSVINTSPSVSGKDAPSLDEIKAMIKYNNGAQNRCVTIKDYEIRIMQMPPRYGCPFRLAAMEENNKVMLYALGLDYNGQLSDALPNQLVRNMINYLSMYRSINDYVEIKSGKIINVSFEVDLFIDKNYIAGDVMKDVINTIKDYMDINKHNLGEDIYISDLQKAISSIDGVLNLIDLRVYNEHGPGYSQTRITQKTKAPSTDVNRDEVDLEDSYYILNSDADAMFEIKHPEADINIVNVMTR